MDYIEGFNVCGTRCFVHGIIDEERPRKDRVVMRFGFVDVPVWGKDERKALIAALVKVDAQMDCSFKEKRGGEVKVTDEQWEQRRYEIAREVLPIFRTLDWCWPDKDCAEAAVALADALIKELKENQS